MKVAVSFDVGLVTHSKYFNRCFVHLMAALGLLSLGCSRGAALVSDDASSNLNAIATDGERNALPPAVNGDVDYVKVGGGQGGLPSIVPEGATEILSRFPILITGGEEPVVLELGGVRTGEPHYVKVEYVNMLKGPIKISEVVSTCGCMVAAKSAEVVEPSKKAHFVLALKPEQRESQFRKSIYVVFEGGPKVAILVNAQFIAPFEIVQSSVSSIGEANEMVDLQLRAKSNEISCSEIQLQSASGSTRVANVRQMPERNMLVANLELNLEARRRLRGDGFVLEVLSIRSSKSGKVFCELPLTLNSGYKYFCRPSLVRFSKDGLGWSAQVLVAGDWTQHDGLEGLKLVSAGEELPNTSVAVSHWGNKLARLEIKMNETLSNEKLTSLAISRSNGERFCAIERFLFEE